MEEEVSLVDYIKVIYRQRLFILLFVLIFLVAGVFGYFAKEAKTYSGEGVLEIGSMDICQKGVCSKFTPESVSVLKSKVENRAYDQKIKDKEINKIKAVEVNLPEDQKDLDKIRILKIKVKAENPESGKIYLEKLLNAIVASHNEQFQKKEIYFKNLIESETAKIKAIEKDKNFLSLQYLYVEHLSNINDAQFSLSSIEKTKIVEIPEKFTSEKKNLILYLGVSLIFGIFVGVFLAFLRDFWQRNKKEITGR